MNKITQSSWYRDTVKSVDWCASTLPFYSILTIDLDLVTNISRVERHTQQQWRRMPHKLCENQNIWLPRYKAVEKIGQSCHVVSCHVQLFSSNQSIFDNAIISTEWAIKSSRLWTQLFWMQLMPYHSYICWVPKNESIDRLSQQKYVSRFFLLLLATTKLCPIRNLWFKRCKL